MTARHTPAGDSQPVPWPFADLARQLQDAPVAAEPILPEPEAGDPGPDPRGPDGPDPDFGPDYGDPGPGGADEPPQQGRPRGEIFDGCPVRPLGQNGDFHYYLDRLGQQRAVKKHEAQVILSLFGDRIDLLCRHFPQYDKEGNRRPGRFDQTSASMTMIAACCERGLFNPDGAVRGVGAWTDEEGRLIYHTGQRLIVAGEAGEPREIDGKIYPAYPPIAGPAGVAVRGDPAAELLAQTETWNWQRPDVDPMLCMGMVGVQILGGALGWRPFFWLTGDASTGKSTLHDLLRYLHGRMALIQSTDATKSGITSRIGHSSLPVALDELEPSEEGSSKERDIINLARVSSSGGEWFRGSADQKGASGNVYSTFMASSILIPGSMKAQDRSRLIILALDALPKGTKKITLRPKDWQERGARLKRVLIDRWAAEGASWAERLELWRVALEAEGVAGRANDNYATVLAMADMMLHAELPAAEVLQGWAAKIAKATRADVDDIGSNAEDMIQHLLGQPLDPFRRGQRYLVAQWLMVAAALPAAPPALVLTGKDGEVYANPIDEEVRLEARKRANGVLAQFGLRVRIDERNPFVCVPELFIPNNKVPNLCQLFERSQWAGGVWSQAARRLPGAQPVKQPLTLAGMQSRGVYIPFSSIPGLLALPMDKAPANPAPPTPEGWEDFA